MLGRDLPTTGVCPTCAAHRSACFFRRHGYLWKCLSNSNLLLPLDMSDTFKYVYIALFFFPFPFFASSFFYFNLTWFVLFSVMFLFRLLSLQAKINNTLCSRMLAGTRQTGAFTALEFFWLSSQIINVDSRRPDPRSNSDRSELIFFWSGLRPNS